MLLKDWQKLKSFFPKENEEEALETIEKALEHFESTEAIIDKEKESDEESTNEEDENDSIYSMI